MTHDELLERIRFRNNPTNYKFNAEQILALQPLVDLREALRAVVELHMPRVNLDLPYQPVCQECEEIYPCPTIQAIEKELA